MSADDIFQKVIEHFLSMEDVKKQGQSLKRNKKMFVMLSKENYIVKLLEKRVNELITSGEGQPYDPGTGKYMRE